MSTADWIVVGIVAIAVVCAVLWMAFRKKSGCVGCSGCCEGCPHARKAKKNEKS